MNDESIHRLLLSHALCILRIYGRCIPILRYIWGMDFVDNMDQYHVVVVTEFVLFFFFSEFSSNIYCVWMWRDGDIGRVSHPAMKQTLASIWKYQLEMIFAFGSCFPRLVSGRFVVIFRIGLNWFGNFDHMCGSDPIDRFGCCPFVIVWLFDVSLGDVSSSLTVGKEEETQRRSG